MDRKMIKRAGLIFAAAAAAALMLAACGGSKKGNDSTKDTAEAPTGQESMQTQPAEPQTQAPVSIGNEKPVSIYYMDYSDNSAHLITSFETPWNDSEDIAYFGIFNTDEPEFTFDSEKYAHLDRWNEPGTDTEYRIGYEISFDADGEHKVITILSPADIARSEDLFDGDVYSETVTGYLCVWLYDDVNQADDVEWYSHVTAGEYNDDTLLTSIKLRLTPEYESVKNLKLKAFSYSSELEFDQDKHYNNAYGYEISILPED